MDDALAGNWLGLQLCRKCGGGQRPLVVELTVRGVEVSGHGSVRLPARTHFSVTGRLDPDSKRVDLRLRFARCVDPHEGYLEGGIVFGQWSCPDARCYGGFKLWRPGEEASASRASAREVQTIAEATDVRGRPGVVRVT